MVISRAPLNGPLPAAWGHSVHGSARGTAEAARIRPSATFNNGGASTSTNWYSAIASRMSICVAVSLPNAVSAATRFKMTSLRKPA